MNHRGAVILVIAAGLLLSAPCLFFGPLPNAKDGVVHLNRAEAFIPQFWSGDLYPRWVTGLNAGLGSPFLFIYPSGAYHLSALLAPLTSAAGLNRDRLLAMDLVMAFGVVASGVLAYWWLAAFVAPWQAAAGAIAYLAAPYHLWMDLYIRYAIAEMLAFAVIPVLLLGAHRLARGERHGVALLALGSGALVATHPLTAYQFAPLVAAYLVVCPAEGQRLRRMLAAIPAGLLGAALAGFYLLPALEHEKWISAEEFVQDPHFYFANSFLILGRELFRWDTAAARTNWYTTWLALMSLALGVAAYLASSKEMRARMRLGFWLAATGAAVFMMSPLSRPLWEHVPLLMGVQFPFRFLTVVTVAVVVLVTGAVSSLSGLGGLGGRLRQICFLALLGLWMTPLLHVGWLYYKQRPMESNYREDRSARADDYRRVWVRTKNESIFHSKGLEEFSVTVPPIAAPRGGEARIVGWRPREIVIEKVVGETPEVWLKQFYYPVWVAATVPEGAAVPLEPSADGLMVVKAPLGWRQIRIHLSYGRLEIAGWILSLAAGLMVGYLLLRKPAAGGSRRAEARLG